MKPRFAILLLNLSDDLLKVKAHLPLQNLTTTAVLSILNSTRSTDIPAILKNLDGAQQDRLMAYLYKASLTASSQWTSDPL